MSGFNIHSKLDSKKVNVTVKETLRVKIRELLATM